MVAESDQPFTQAKEQLADRLRDLREHRRLTQKQLASVLSTREQVGVTTISSWENPSPDKLPTLDRLKVYARLFCTNRSFDSESLRLLRDDELTEEERHEESALYDEFRRLRGQVRSTDVASPAAKQSSSIWRYPDGAAVSIVCSVADDPPEYATKDHLNYTSFARFADLDALIAVHGQIKADNPKSDVQIMSLQEFKPKDAGSHVVIIGGRAADDQVGRLLCRNLLLPKAEEEGYAVGDMTWDSHIFRFGKENQVLKASFDHEGLIGDIGVFARGPHPSIQHLTVTVCNGITSRGVLGAVLCFIDPHLKTRNEQYVKDHLGDLQTYCICMEVEVVRGDAAAPDLSAPDKTWYYRLALSRQDQRKSANPMWPYRWESSGSVETPAVSPGSTTALP